MAVPLNLDSKTVLEVESHSKVKDMIGFARKYFLVCVTIFTLLCLTRSREEVFGDLVAHGDRLTASIPNQIELFTFSSHYQLY
jgi:hypothetical protein